VNDSLQDYRSPLQNNYSPHTYTHLQIGQKKYTLKNTGICRKWHDQICMPQTSEYVCIRSTTKDPVNNCHQDYELLQEEKYISQEDMLSERTPQQYISETKETSK